LFAKPEEENELTESLKNGRVRVQAEISFDSQFANDLQAEFLAYRRPRHVQADRIRLQSSVSSCMLILK
jgi:hypothetical protein